MAAILIRQTIVAFKRHGLAGVQLRRGRIDQCRRQPVVVLVNPQRLGERQQRDDAAVRPVASPNQGLEPAGGEHGFGRRRDQLFDESMCFVRAQSIQVPARGDHRLQVGMGGKLGVPERRIADEDDPRHGILGQDRQQAQISERVRLQAFRIIDDECEPLVSRLSRRHDIE